MDSNSSERTSKSPKSIQKAVEEYAACGFVLCRLKTGKDAKAPADKGWPTRGETEPARFKNHGIGLNHALSRTVSLDLDDVMQARPWFLKRRVDLDKYLDAPNAVQVLSGRENRAKLIYRLPPGAELLPTKQVILRGDKVPILELRCVGAQDVLPPSIHPETGKSYEWSGDFTDLPDLPGPIHTAWKKLAGPIGKGGASAESQRLGKASGLLSALHALSPDIGYHPWITLMMAFKEGGGTAEEFDEWSSRSAGKYQGIDDIWTHWASLDKNPAIGKKVTAASLFDKAIKAGWKPGKGVDPAPMTDEELDGVERATADDLRQGKAASPNFPPPFTGPMTLLAEAALETARRPRPGLATMVALSGMAAGCNGRFQLWDGTRLNLYMTVLMPTGGGKEQAREVAEQIAREAGATVIGKTASGSALEKVLYDYAAVYMSIDEASHLYASMNGGGAVGYMQDFAATTLKLFGSGGGDYYKRKKADEDILPEELRVMHPCLNIFAFSTSAKFAEVTKRGDIEDGSVNRHLFYIDDDHIDKRIVSSRFRMPDSAKNRAFEIDEAASTAEFRDDKTITVVQGRNVERWIADYNDETNLREKHASSHPLEHLIVARTFEKVMKVAGVLAIWDAPRSPLMQVPHLEWAKQFVEASDDVLLDFAGHRMHDSKVLADADRLMETCRRIMRGELKVQTGTEREWLEKGFIPRTAALRHFHKTIDELILAIRHLEAMDQMQAVVRDGKGPKAPKVQLLVLRKGGEE